MREQRSITEVVFAKEDILSKKLLTTFLIDQEIQFIPDQHKFGSYQAYVKINQLPQHRTQLSSCAYSTPKKYSDNLVGSLSMQHDTETEQQEHVKLLSQQPQSCVKEEDQVIWRIAEQKAILLNQVDKLLKYKPLKPDKQRQNLEDLRSRIADLNDVAIIFSHIKRYLLGPISGSSDCGMCLSLFMVVLYFHYLGHERYYQWESYGVIQKSQHEVSYIELAALVQLFESIFIQRNQRNVDVSKSYLQRFIDATIQKKQKYHNMFELCCLFMDDPDFSIKLTKMVSSHPSDGMLFRNNKTLPSEQDSSLTKTPPFSLKTMKPKSVSPFELNSVKIAKPNSSQLNSSLLCNRTMHNKPNHCYQPTLNKQNRKSPNTDKQNSSKKRDTTVNNNSNKKTYKQQNLDTMQDQANQLQSSGKSLNDLDKVFKRIINEQINKNHTQWFKKLQVLPKYQMSPKSFENNYQDILSKLLVDKIESMSSQELIVYYEYTNRKAKSLYKKFLRDRGIQLRKYNGLL